MNKKLKNLKRHAEKFGLSKEKTDKLLKRVGEDMKNRKTYSLAIATVDALRKIKK